MGIMDHTIQWQGMAVSIRHVANWSGTGLDHIEVRSIKPERAPLVTALGQVNIRDAKIATHVILTWGKNSQLENLRAGMMPVRQFENQILIKMRFFVNKLNSKQSYISRFIQVPAKYTSFLILASIINLNAS